MEERICKACRDKFMPKVHNQIYCPDCSKNPKMSARMYSDRQKKYREILSETINDFVSCICIQCGKTVLSKYHTDFCSMTCRQAYLDAKVVNSPSQASLTASQS